MPLALRTFALVLALGAMNRAHAARADAFALAAEHYRQKRWDRACDEFARLLVDEPNHARRDDAQFFYGEALAQLGRWREAREQFSALLNRDPPKRYARQALFRAGEAAYMLGDDRAARDDLQAFRARFSGDELDAYVLPYLGSLALSRGESAVAETVFAESLKRFPEGPLAVESRLGLAQSRHQSGRLDEAAAGYRQVIASGSPLAEQALLQLATAENARGDYRAALVALDQFADRFAGSPLADRERLGRGYTLYRLDRHAEAQAALAQLADHPAFGVEARYWSALALEGQHKWQEAAEALAGLADESDGRLAAAIAFHRADAVRRAGHADQAAELFDDALQRFAASDWADDCLLGRLRVALDAGDNAAAVELADKLATEYSNSPLLPSAMLAKGQALLAADKPKEAARVLERLIGDASAAAKDTELASHVRASLALARARLGQFDAAERLLTELNAAASDNELTAGTTYEIAELASSAGQAELAEKLFGRVTGDHSQQISGRAQSGLAWNHFAAGRWDEAAAAFDEVLRADASGKLAPEAALLRGVALEHLERFDEALAMYDSVVARYGQSSRAAEARLRSARLHEQQGAPDAALADYNALIDTATDFAERDSALYRSALLMLPTDPTSAAARFERLLTEFPTSRFADDARLRLAESGIESGRFDEAERLLVELVRPGVADDVRAHAWYLTGRMEIGRQRWPAAAAALDRLLGQFPEGELAETAAYLLAEAEFRQGQFEGAADRLTRLAEETKGRDDAWLAQAELRRAQSLAQLKRWDESADVARGIADRFPTFDRMFEAEYLIGRAYAAQADFASARQWYAKAGSRPEAAGSETAAMAQWMEGESHFHQENYAAALEAYLKVDATHPRWHAAALLQAGKCQEQLGRWQQAAELYQRLLAAHGDSALAREATTRLEAARRRAARPATKQ